MTGIYGFHKQQTTDSSADLLQKIVLRLGSLNHEQESRTIQNGFGIVQFDFNFKNLQNQPVWNDNHSIATFFIGEIFNQDDLAKKYNITYSSGNKFSDCELIARLYEKTGTDFAVSLNGSFLILIYELDTEKLIIINDRLGLFPLYYSIVENGLIFGTTIQGILADKSIQREPDLTAISEFLTFDHMLGQRTMIDAIKLLPQSSILKYENHRLKISSYYNFEFTKKHPLKTDDAYIEELIHYMRQAVARQSISNLPTGLLLSGGLDSRFILAIMAEQKLLDLNTFTWSIPGSDDSRYAKECADKSKAHHHFYELKPDWLVEKAEQAILLTSGNGNLTNLHAFATLDEEAKIANIIYKGFMGDAMFGFGIRPRFWADYDYETMMEQHIEAYRDYRVLTFDPNDHHLFFTDSFIQKTKEEWKNEFNTGMLACGCNQMADHRSYFDLKQRVPRMTINGVDVVRNKTTVRLPFTDNDLVEFSLTIPPHLRYQRQLMNRTFIQYFPEYAKIPIAQTQLPMMHCARELMVRNKQFIQWHLRNRGLEKLAGPVTRPYKDYNNWFRTTLRSWVEGILLDNTTLNRGYLKSDEIKKLVHDHMAGKNYAVRLSAILSIELSHRLFLD